MVSREANNIGTREYTKLKCRSGWEKLYGASGSLMFYNETPLAGTLIYFKRFNKIRIYILTSRECVTTFHLTVKNNVFIILNIIEKYSSVGFSYIKKLSVRIPYILYTLY